MPIIEHSGVRMPPAADYRRERAFVSSHNGAASLTVKEVELLPGWEGRLHTHPTDLAIMVTAGGAAGFEPPDALRVDYSVIRVGNGEEVRLPYLKFPRNPMQR